MRAISLAYHDVCAPDESATSIYTLTPEGFALHLWSIRRSVGENRIRTAYSGVDWDLPVFLTFDDGFLGMYTRVAGMLEENGWHGHFFIITDRIGAPGFLNESQIRELRQRGHVIGSHSHSHPERMSHLTATQMRIEWKESTTRLNNLLGEPVEVASVPNGYYSHTVAETAAE